MLNIINYNKKYNNYNKILIINYKILIIILQINNNNYNN